MTTPNTLGTETPKPAGKPGAAFERLAAAVHKKLGPDSKVRWDDRINGCQIDVSIRGRVGGVGLLVIVECRDYQDTLGKDHVRRLIAVQEETGANKAILVTSVGFTRPALELAANKGIDTCVLRPAVTDDWPDDAKPIREITMSINLIGTAVEDVELELTDGTIVASSAMAQIDDGCGNHAFIDHIVLHWLRSDDGKGKEGGRHNLSLTPPGILLCDGEQPRVKAIRCTTRPTEWPDFKSGTIWKAPEEWVFRKHRPDRVVEEAQFFLFEDLKTMAEEFAKEKQS